MSMTTAAFFGMGAVVLYGLAALGIAFFAGRKPARHGRSKS
ncbi:hypothetical protein [Acidithiobacillus sp.]